MNTEDSGCRPGSVAWRVVHGRQHRSTLASIHPPQVAIVGFGTVVARPWCDGDSATLDSARPFRDQFDFDSMDQLNFVVGLHKPLGIDVPEADYPQLATLAGCVSYLARALRVS